MEPAMQMGEALNSSTYRVKTSNGSVFVTVGDDRDGNPILVQVYLGKSGTEVAAWTNAIGLVMTLALRKGAAINDFIELLSGQASDRQPTIDDNVTVRSTIEALNVALLRYRRDKYLKLREQLGGSDDDDERGRPPRIFR